MNRMMFARYSVVISIFAIAFFGAHSCAEVKRQVNKMAKTTEELQDDVKRMYEEHEEFRGITLEEVSLVHEGGNKYDGFIVCSGNGQKEQFSITVTFDGEHILIDNSEIGVSALHSLREKP